MDSSLQNKRLSLTLPKLGTQLKSTINCPLLPRELWTKILLKVNYSTLVQVRAVSSLLNEICVEIIRQNDLCRVNFFFDYENRVYTDEYRDFNFDELINLLKNSYKFPTTNFFIWDGFLLTSDPMKMFFQNFGHFITTLKLQLDSHNFLSRPVYFQVLSQLAPTLKHFTIFDSMREDERLIYSELDDIIEDDPIHDVKGQLCLPKLETFSFQLFQNDQMDDCIQEILGAAVNLKVITNSELNWPEVRFANYLMSLRPDRRHLNKLTWFNFEPEEFPCDLEILEEVVDGLRSLEKIKFNLYNVEGSLGRSRWLGCSRLISKLLKLNAFNCREIILDTPIGFLPQLDWPVMTQVKKMTLTLPSEVSFGWFDEENYSILPELNWTVTFPKLIEVTLQFNDQCHSFWSLQKFPLQGLAGNVKKLVISRLVESAKFQDRWFRSLNNFFNGLEHLNLGHVHLKEFSLVGRKLWNLTNLKTIKFSLYSCSNSNSRISMDFPLDAILTGFSSQTCLVLRNIVPLVQFRKEEELRVGPSILNLKELRQLNIRLIYPPQNLKLMSHVSSLYAFNLMSNLKVNVTIKSSEITEIEESWELIASHINIQFEK